MGSKIRITISSSRPPLRRLFCACIAQNNQLRFGGLTGRYVFMG